MSLCAGLRSLAVLAAVSIVAALPSIAEASELLAHERYSLANGLDVILHVDRKLPLVAVNLSYHVGSGHDGARPGLAHLTEHLMFRGTRDVDDGDHWALLIDAGAHHNATTYLENTSYHAVLPRNQLPLLLWLESNRMAVLLPALDGRKVDEEIKTTIDEWRYRVSSTRMGRAWDEVGAAIVPAGHPWEQARPEQINQLTLTDVAEFVRRYHGPANATLVLAGDLPEDVRGQVERYFGRREGGERPPAVDCTLPAQTAERRIERVSEFATNPFVLVHWPSPAIFASGDAEADIIARALEDRVWQLAEQLAPGALAYVDAHQRSHVGLSEFAVALEGTSAATPERLLALFDAALTDLRERPPTAEDIGRVRRSMTLATLNGMQDLASRAHRMQIYVNAGKPADWLDEDLGRYERVTPGTIVRVLADTFAIERRTVVLALPAEGG